MLIRERCAALGIRCDQIWDQSRGEMLRLVATQMRWALPGFATVATCGYIRGMGTGIRELKDNLSAYIRRVEAGERVAVTAHGRVVAELVPPGARAHRGTSRWEDLVSAGVLHPPVEAGDPFADWPDIRLPRGTASELIDSDRGEA